MPFVDTDKYLIPLMMRIIVQNFGEKTYDFEMAQQCSGHAGYMAVVGGDHFHSAVALWGSATAENVAHDVVQQGNFLGAVERIILRLLNSPVHRYNLEKHPVIGVGTAVRYEQDGSVKLYVAQRFRR
jgi:uncharacterized protein YkwD